MYINDYDKYKDYKINDLESINKEHREINGKLREEIKELILENDKLESELKHAYERLDVALKDLEVLQVKILNIKEVLYEE